MTPHPLDFIFQEVIHVLSLSLIKKRECLISGHPAIRFNEQDSTLQSTCMIMYRLGQQHYVLFILCIVWQLTKSK